MKKLVFISILALAIFSNCKKDDFLTDPSKLLSFSVDTLTFDTVFVSFGSTTKFIRIFNTHDQPIMIDEIKLLGKQGNQFRINVDGTPGNVQKNIEVPAKDSLYIFAEVTIDPTITNNPFVLVDDIQFSFNGNVQTVHLQAWGQNAYFHYGEIIAKGTNETWNIDKPHVIVRGPLFPGVFVDSNAVLTIPAGARIFVHQNAGLFVSGRLLVNGTKTDSVIFEGDRLEPLFDDEVGQWLGVFLLRGSTGNILEHAVISEAFFGLSVGSSFNSNLATFTDASRPDVELRKTIIKYNLNSGIFGFNANIKASNSLIYGSGGTLVALGLGGSYEFDNCTFHNTSDFSFNHNDEMVLLSNAAISNAGTFLNDLEIARFTNCIIYGSLEEELAFNNENGADFNHSFQHCIIRTEADTTTNFSNVISDQAPGFEDRFNDDFQLNEFSVAIDAGTTVSTTPIDDICDVIRVNQPDIGAFEAQ